MSDEWAVQISPKLADGTLVNVRAGTTEELSYILDGFNEELTAKIAGTIGLLQAAGNVAGLAASAAQQSSRQGPPPRGNRPGPAPRQVSNDPDESCVHGQRVRRSGTSTKGPWAALFCPQPKGSSDACDPVWL